MSSFRSRFHLCLAVLCLILLLSAGPLAAGGQPTLPVPLTTAQALTLPPCADTPEPGAILVFFQQGADGYTGAEDTTLRLGSGPLYDAWYLHVGYRKQNGFLLRYDLSSIPDGSRVVCATQRLYGEMWSGAPFELELGAFAVTRPWTVTEATYSLAASGMPWQVGGCIGPDDRRPVPEVTFTATQVQHWYELDVTGIVSEWVSGATPNLGLSFQALDRFDEDSLYFTGSDDVTPSGFTGNRPILVVLYVPPPAPTPTATVIPTLTPEPTNTPSEPPVATPTATLPAEPTLTPTGPAEATATPTPYEPPEPTATPTGPLEPTATPTENGPFQPRATATPTPYGPPEPTERPTGPLEPTATPTETGPFEPTATATPTPFGSPEPSATPTETSSAEPTATPTSTEPGVATPTATPTGPLEPTVTPTLSPTPVPTPYRLYVTMIALNYPMRCVNWGNVFAEEFGDADLEGWTTHLGGGQQLVSNGYVHQWTGQTADRFPMLWRNDLFEGAGQDFLLEIRFRYSDFTAYGTTIALNSAPFDGHRVPDTHDLPHGIEEVLNIHHVVDPVGGVYRFDVSMFEGLVRWTGTPGDTDWHVVQMSLEQGDLYTLYVDGDLVGQVHSSIRPISTYIGNPTIQIWPGPWTQVYVDYIRISRCLLWAPF